MVSKIDSSKIDTLTFTTIFAPAFEEVSLVKLIKIDTVINLDILIESMVRADTFYYKSKSISQNQFIKIDTSLIRKAKITHLQKQDNGFDGISILFELIEKKDTSRIVFWSPGKDDEILGYGMTKSAIDNFKSLFNDQIIAEYFDDLETYIDKSKFSMHSKKIREIDKRREVKYGWHKEID